MYVEQVREMKTNWGAGTNFKKRCRKLRLAIFASTSNNSPRHSRVHLISCFFNQTAYKMFTWLRTITLCSTVWGQKKSLACTSTFLHSQTRSKRPRKVRKCQSSSASNLSASSEYGSNFMQALREAKYSRWLPVMFGHLLSTHNKKRHSWQVLQSIHCNTVCFFKKDKHSKYFLILFF